MLSFLLLHTNNSLSDTNSGGLLVVYARIKLPICHIGRNKSWWIWKWPHWPLASQRCYTWNNMVFRWARPYHQLSHVDIPKHVRLAGSRFMRIFCIGAINSERGKEKYIFMGAYNFSRWGERRVPGFEGKEGFFVCKSRWWWKIMMRSFASQVSRPLGMVPMCSKCSNQISLFSPLDLQKVSSDCSY